MQTFNISPKTTENLYKPSYSNSQNSISSIKAVAFKIFQSISQFFTGLASSVKNFFFPDAYGLEPSAPGFGDLPIAQEIFGDPIQAMNVQAYLE